MSNEVCCEVIVYIGFIGVGIYIKELLGRCVSIVVKIVGDFRIICYSVYFIGFCVGIGVKGDCVG